MVMWHFIPITPQATLFCCRERWTIQQKHPGRCSLYIIISPWVFSMVMWHFIPITPQATLFPCRHCKAALTRWLATSITLVFWQKNQQYQTDNGTNPLNLQKIIKPIGTEWCYTRLLVIPWQVRIPITLTPICVIRPKTSEAVRTCLAECDSDECQFLHFVLLFRPSGLRNSASNFFSNSSNTDSHLRERPNKKCALQ